MGKIGRQAIFVDHYKDELEGLKAAEVERSYKKLDDMLSEYYSRSFTFAAC